MHNIGEVWAIALLEVRARFITRLGWATGNQRILQFVTDGMKLDPVNPTLLQGRDAILAAAEAGGGTAADIADIWAGFAARGMGVSAQVLNAATGQVVQAFDLPGISRRRRDARDGIHPERAARSGEIGDDVALRRPTPAWRPAAASPGRCWPRAACGRLRARSRTGHAAGRDGVPHATRSPWPPPCGATLTATLQTQESGGPTRNLSLPVRGQPGALTSARTLTP